MLVTLFILRKYSLTPGWMENENMELGTRFRFCQPRPSLAFKWSSLFLHKEPKIAQWRAQPISKVWLIVVNSMQAGVIMKEHKCSACKRASTLAVDRITAASSTQSGGCLLPHSELTRLTNLLMWLHKVSMPNHGPWSRSRLLICRETT